jgi:hypothetical protein
MNIQDCVVCNSNQTEPFQTSDNLNYWHCNSCCTKFLDQKHFIDKDSEKKRYLEHENIIEDMGYRNFLSKLSNPLMKKIKATAKGLDFGCGHGPALADIFKSNNYSIDIYDPFFFPNDDIFSKKYDFITCTETAEHFFNPKKEFDLINKLLKKEGWLGVMTSFLPTQEAFDSWHYRRDPTHVVFYAEETFEVIAQQRNWHCEIITKDVVLFYKK